MKGINGQFFNPHLLENSTGYRFIQNYNICHNKKNFYTLFFHI